MNNIYCVGNVLSIEGNRIKVLMHQNTNMFKYFFAGNIYNGVSINEYVGIIRGPYKIVAKVSKEYLSDKLKNTNDRTYSMDRFERVVEVDVVGYFQGSNFNYGIKYFPMIFNEVVLLSDKENEKIISSFVKGKNPHLKLDNASEAKTKDSNIDGELCIGFTLNDTFEVKLDIFNLFNTHIGIFGNTGSGKSNTLAKLYTELLNKNNVDIFKNSKFILLDFNGEYVGSSVFENNNKNVLQLDTSIGRDKIPVSPEKFWSREFLSIIFSATEKTQQPFIGNMLKHYKNKLNDLYTNKVCKNTFIKDVIEQSFKNVLHGNNDIEMLNLLKKMLSLVSGNDPSDLSTFFDSIEWHSTCKTYYTNDYYFNDIQNTGLIQACFEDKLKKLNLCEISDFELLIVLINAQLIYGLRYKHVQYDHINPLLARINSSIDYLEKTIEIRDKNYEGFTVISMRKCNLDAKQVLPMVIAQQLYDEHIESTYNNTEITKTVHLIIDEAHNILSEKSPRENEQFKDYRLDVFEKMIKEGRKFGFYLTISSQRPHDISHTIMSQLHNYFIHRLVNELDLRMISSTVSDLDKVSLSILPKLGDGQCIISGTSFTYPNIVQITKLDKKHSPASDSANSRSLWKSNN